MIIEITKEEIKTHWRYVDQVNSREYHILRNRNAIMRLATKEKKYFYRVK